MAALDVFLKSFYTEYNDISEQLTNLTPVADDDECAKLELSKKYEIIGNRVDSLQKLFTDYSSHLSLYEQRKAQEHLTKISQQASQKRNDLFPKKKFAFKKKQNLTTATKIIEDSEKALSKKQDEKNVEINQNLADLNTNHTCTIKDKSNETIVKVETELLNADIGIINCKNCVIKLYGQPSVIHISNIEDCVILCGPMSGSAFVNKCLNSKLNLACHQLRIHETRDSQFYIHVSSRSIIENCSNVKFSPYAWSYHNISDNFKTSGILHEANSDDSWKNIDDFNWLVSDQQSPNWNFLPQNERLNWKD